MQIVQRQTRLLLISLPALHTALSRTVSTVISANTHTHTHTVFIASFPFNDAGATQFFSCCCCSSSFIFILHFILRVKSTEDECRMQSKTEIVHINIYDIYDECRLVYMYIYGDGCTVQCKMKYYIILYCYITRTNMLCTCAVHALVILPLFDSPRLLKPSTTAGWDVFVCVQNSVGRLMLIH